MSRKLKAYFAHSRQTKDLPEKRHIMEILNNRTVKVIDSFEDDAVNFYKSVDYAVGRAIWIKNLQKIRECDMLVAWIPELHTPSFMGTAYEICFAYMSHPTKFIQVITPRKPMFLAYIIGGGNQLFSSIEAFEKLRRAAW